MSSPDCVRDKRGKIAAAFGLHPTRIEHLLNRYGVTTDELLDLIRETPSLGNAQPGEVSNYLKRVQAERDSQFEPDDESADRLRPEAPHIITVR